MHVRFKLRTADICVECINSLLRNQVSTLKVEQILRLLESMREEMKYSMHFHRNFTHSRLHLNVDENLLTLVDYEGKSIMLTPKEMTFYLLFLLNPDGIRYSHLVDHRPTLRRLYIRARRITPVAYDIEHYKSIESAIRPLRRDISTVVSHIKEKFIEAIGPTFSLPYLIEGPDGDQKKISLSREYVIDYPNF